MKKLLLLILSIGAFSTSVFANNELANTTWLLNTYNGNTATGSLNFGEFTISSKFCNNVNQGYVFSGNALYASGMSISTMMYCSGLPMTLESNFIISASGTPIILSGNTITISTSGQNNFVFTKKNIIISDLSSDCIQAYDGCNNMCTRKSGTTGRTCTEIACNTPKDAKCIMSSNNINTAQPVCTMEYNPICGNLYTDCKDTGSACSNTTSKTYGNFCQLNAEKATFLYTGECNSSGLVSNDKDTHGCIGSAGYSRSQSQNKCIRIWETKITDLEKAYDLAYNYNITTMNTLKKFRVGDKVTRQEASKMFVNMAEKIFNKKYASYPDECNIAYFDEDSFDSTLKIYIYNACAHGIMKGSKQSFYPNANLTKGEALAILMRTVDGGQDTEKTTDPRRMVYADRASKLNYLNFDSFEDFEKPITRGELIKWIYTISIKKS